MAGEIHRGDIGTVFIATIKNENDVAVDISNATTMKLNFLPPGTPNILSKNAVFHTDGTDGKLSYISQSGDLSTVGIWSIQGFIETPSGVWHSTIETFRIAPNLGEL